MQMRFLLVWITITALLQWSWAQEDNIQEISLSGGVESPDQKEDNLPETKEDINKSPGEIQTTTDLPGGGPLTDAADMPQVNDHQSAENGKEQPAGLGMGTQDLPSDGSQISEMSAEETTTGTTSPPPGEVQDKEKPTNQEPTSSSEGDSDILKKPLTSPHEGVGASDYQDDSPSENNSPKLETTPPAPTPAPVYHPQSCYSCLMCNATVRDDQKTICKPSAGDRNGCFTMLVKDKNLLPGKMNYVERGCSSELSEPFVRYCRNNKELCQKCDGNYCNVHDMTKLQLAATGGATLPRLLAPLLIGSICLVSCWRRQVFY